MMNGFLFVGLGGAIGACLRHGAVLAVGSGALATLLVNVFGSLALGLLAGWQLARSGEAAGALWLFLGVGVLGAFTTFSAFSRETINMVLQGEAVRAVAYAGLTMTGALAGFAIGLLVARRLLA